MQGAVGRWAEVGWVTLRALPQTLHGKDVALRAAAVTFYGGIAVVPGIVLGVWVVGFVIGADRVEALGDALADALPTAMGAPGAVTALVEAGTTLTSAAAFACLFPASLYGEGLRRAFASLTGARENWIGWRGRLLFLPAVLAAPLPLFVLLLAAPTVSGLFAAESGGRVLGVMVAFLVDWILVSAALIWAYRIVAPARAGWPAVIIGSFAAGSFVAGFVQGFVLFLAIPVDLGVPFGGFDHVGAAVAVGLWLYLLHLIVLVGYAATLRFDQALDDRPDGRRVSAAARPGTGRP